MASRSQTTAFCTSRCPRTRWHASRSRGGGAGEFTGRVIPRGGIGPSSSLRRHGLSGSDALAQDDSLEHVTSENPFGQVLVALVTPMTADGEVDWTGVEKHIDDVITAGADGIVVTGTTGETSTLTDPEKIKLVEVGKDVAAGRAKIITGGGSDETAHAIRSEEHTSEL